MPTPLLFESGDFSQNDAEEVWREGLGSIYEIDREKDPLAPFNASMESWDMGAMVLTRHVAHNGVHFQRTKRKIATSGIDHYLVHCLLDGALTSTFGRERQQVPHGSVVVRDLSVENSAFARNAPMLTLTIPRQAIDRRTAGGLRIHGVCWEASDPIGVLIASHMRSLAGVATEMNSEQSSVAAAATLDFLAACLVRRAERWTESGDPRLTPMMRAQALSFIESNLADPSLGAATLCGTLKISRTALYELFEPLVGVAEYVRTRRLNEAMRRLESPMHARDFVSTIACAVGFQSESTFNRTFKEHFGCTPTQAREVGVSKASTPGTPGVAEAGRKFRDQHSIAAQTDAMVRRLGAL
jgi:AraC-like DNA-binding protein